MPHLFLLENMVEVLFGLALFINAALFVPQFVKILKKKNSEDISLITFSGLLLIQAITVIHGLITEDHILIIGYVISMITTGAVVGIAIKYKDSKVKQSHLIGLDQILEQLPGHIYWKDKNGAMLGCNKRNWQDFGFKKYKDIIGTTGYSYMLKEEAQKLELFDQSVIREKKLKIDEEIFTCADGNCTRYLSHKVPLRDEIGEIIGLIGVSLDITTSKQDILEKLRLLENIIAIMPAYVYWMDRDGTYLGCSDKEAEAVGIASRHEIVGKKNTDLAGFLIPEALDPINKKVMETGESIVLEEPATLQGGIEATFLSSKVPLKNTKNEVVGMVGISIDITERKKQEKDLIQAKEEAEKANQSKSQVIENLEHDIRTPLAGAIGILTILADRETDQDMKPVVEECASSVESLLEYCDTIIAYARQNNVSIPILSKRFNLIEIVDKAISIENISVINNNLQSAATDKNLSLNVEKDSNLPNVVIGDEFRIKSILINLLGNAIKFTSEGEVSLKVTQEKSSISRSTVVRFVVSDTGIGISKDKQQSIFEIFGKIEPSNRSFKNTPGLGLRLVKKYVEELSGDIDVISEIGKGSTFIVDIPLKLPLVE